MITKEATGKKAEILLVENNPGDVRLTMEALKDGKAFSELLHHQTCGLYSIRQGDQGH